METFNILCEPLEDAGGWEMELCTNTSNGYKTASRRKAIYNVLEVCGVDISWDIFNSFSDMAIDQILIDSSINIVFHDSME